MRRNEESSKLCNTCEHKEKSKPKPKEKDMSQVKISINCDQKEFAKIEEMCNEQNITFSDYFMSLHAMNEESKHQFGKELMDQMDKNIKEIAEKEQIQEKKSLKNQKGSKK